MQHAPPDVMQAEVTELVRDDCLDLLRRQALDQRIKQDDALVGAEAGEISVAMRRAA